MTTNIILLSAIIVSGLLTVFLLNSIVNSRLKGKISDNEHPITGDIIKAVLFLCGGLLLGEMVVSFQTMTRVLPSSFKGNDLLIKEILYFSIFLGITFLTLLANIWLSSIMFSVTSKGKSIFMETANNNLNAVIIFCGIALSLSLAAQSGLTPLLDQFIPYPKMPVYYRP